mmetsp:Transcript_39131/g.103686  ORF Transcript_39131/g.103686 Transcript_39131/m.103686 type:complete len:209 (-) Transcript_39131:234-860(-)
MHVACRKSGAGRDSEQCVERLDLEEALATLPVSSEPGEGTIWAQARSSARLHVRGHAARERWRGRGRLRGPGMHLDRLPRAWCRLPQRRGEPARRVRVQLGARRHRGLRGESRRAAAGAHLRPRQQGFEGRLFRGRRRRPGRSYAAVPLGRTLEGCLAGRRCGHFMCHHVATKPRRCLQKARGPGLLRTLPSAQSRGWQRERRGAGRW